MQMTEAIKSDFSSSARPSRYTGAGNSCFINGVLDSVDVLFVDDAFNASYDLARVLGNYGARVTVVGSGAEAIHELNSNIYDVMICELELVDMSAHELIRLIRDRSPRALGVLGMMSRNVPAAVISDQGGGLRRRQSLELGFQTHLTKPLDHEHLVSVVAWLAEAK